MMNVSAIYAGWHDIMVFSLPDDCTFNNNGTCKVNKCIICDIDKSSYPAKYVCRECERSYYVPVWYLLWESRVKWQYVVDYGNRHSLLVSLSMVRPWVNMMCIICYPDSASRMHACVCTRLLCIRWCISLYQHIEDMIHSILPWNYIDE